MQAFFGVLVLLSVVYQLCFRYETVVDKAHPDHVVQQDTLTGQSHTLPASEIRKQQKPIDPRAWIAQANKILTTSFIKGEVFGGSIVQPFISTQKEYGSGKDNFIVNPSSTPNKDDITDNTPIKPAISPSKVEQLKSLYNTHKPHGFTASLIPKKSTSKPAVASNLHSIYYQTPNEMKLNKATLYRVEIPLDKNTEKQVQAAFNKDGHFDSSKIKTSKYMTAVLNGDDAFSIKGASQTAQLADADTKRFSWQWYVTPTQAGAHVLTLTVYAGKGEDVSYRDAWEREINVEVPSSEWGYLVTKYLVDNWVWLSPLALFFFGLLQKWWKKTTEKTPKTKKGKKMTNPVSPDAKKKKSETTKV
jgi:hypothetical protein